MRMGLLGGAFNPPHLGHMLLAQEACDQLELDSVVFMPSFDPPHKIMTTPYRHRLEMCRLATNEDRRFRTSALESASSGYTVDTLRYYATYQPERKLFLILGGDQAGAFFSWEEPEEILNMATPVVNERTMYDRELIEDHWGGRAAILNFLDMPPLEISSSMIRWRAEEGSSIRYLVADPVVHYIHLHNLYAREEATTEPTAL